MELGHKQIMGVVFSMLKPEEIVFIHRSKHVTHTLHKIQAVCLFYTRTKRMQVVVIGVHMWTLLVLVLSFY